MLVLIPRVSAHLSNRGWSWSGMQGAVDPGIEQQRLELVGVLTSDSLAAKEPRLKALGGPPASTGGLRGGGLTFPGGS